jgi:8-oxo-dGTP pyrophosphatase MutT (NUDIX family)
VGPTCRGRVGSSDPPISPLGAEERPGAGMCYRCRVPPDDVTGDAAGSEPGRGSGEAGLRASVHALVSAHQPADDREAVARGRILDELDRLPHPFSESAGPVHVTGSVIIVGPRGTVLHRHRRLHRWMQPGGHCDPGEHPAEAALREGEEETGLRLEHLPGGPRLVHVDVHPAAKAHVHLDLRYVVLAPDGSDPSPPPGESPEVAWFGWDDAAAMADDALVGALGPARHAYERILSGGGRTS